MIRMGFHIQGAQYLGFSIGTIYLAFWWNQTPLLYASSIAQGMGGSSCNSHPSFTISNDLTNNEDAHLLQNFVGHNVQLKLESVYLGNGPVSMTFKIFSEDRATPIYQVERRPNIRGLNFGNCDVTTTFRRLVLNLNHRRSMTDIIAHGIGNALTMGNMSDPDTLAHQNDIFLMTMTGQPYIPGN